MCDRADAASAVDALIRNAMDNLEKPAFLRKQAESDVVPVDTPAGLLAAFNDVALRAKDFGEALQEILRQKIGEEIVNLVSTITMKAGNRETAWALLLDWLLIQLAGQCALDRHAQRLLRPQLAGVSGDVKLSTAKTFATALPDIDSENWRAPQLTLVDRISKRLKIRI